MESGVNVSSEKGWLPNFNQIPKFKRGICAQVALHFLHSEQVWRMQAQPDPGVND